MEPEDLAVRAKNTRDPMRGLLAVSALRRQTDVLEFEQVKSALAAGYTWTEISIGLGVSRQAVHKKYARRVKAIGDGGPESGRNNV